MYLNVFTKLNVYILSAEKNNPGLRGSHTVSLVLVPGKSQHNQVDYDFILITLPIKIRSCKVISPYLHNIKNATNASGYCYNKAIQSNFSLRSSN